MTIHTTTNPWQINALLERIDKHRRGARLSLKYSRDFPAHVAHVECCIELELLLENI